MTRIISIRTFLCSLFAVLVIAPAAFAQRGGAGGNGQTTIPSNPGPLTLAPSDLTVKSIALDANNYKTARVRVENNGPGKSTQTTLLIKYLGCDCPAGAAKEKSLTVPALKKGEGVWITVHSDCVITLDAYWTATIDPTKAQNDSNWNNNSQISDTKIK